MSHDLDGIKMTILPPYEAPYKPVPQVTPFTYRDGITMLKKLELLQRYINRELVPFVNDNMEELGDAFETQVNALIEAVNAAIDMVINESIEVQDDVVAGIFDNAVSDTRAITDALYAAKSVEATVASHTTEIGENTTGLANIHTRVDRLARHVKDFGAIGDGVANDTAALQTAINSGFPLYWGGPNDVYKVNAALVRTLTSDIAWSSDGATIKVDPTSTHIHRVVDINTSGFNVEISGPLTVDASNKANSAWSFRNETLTYAKFASVEMRAKNVFRQDQLMTGGDGIYIRGAFTTVYIERPDVRDIVMAAGAGVSGIQGVAGISVVAHGVGMAPNEINIIAPYIMNVYSQDVAYLMDQDGIRIFTEENTTSINPFPTHFNIRGGSIINCGGRAIKTQCEWGTVDGVYIARRSSAPWGSRTGGMPEIDFQTAGGTIRNVEFSYVSNTPLRVISWSGTLLAGGKNTSGILVSGIKLGYSGSQEIGRFMSATLAEQIHGVVTVENVEIVSSSKLIQQYFMTVQGTYTGTQQIIVRMSNITAPILSTMPFLYRVGAAVPTNSSLHNLANTAASGNAAFSALNNAGSYTQVTSGNNIKVV